MSNFIGEVINPATGKTEPAVFVDTGKSYKAAFFTETFSDTDYPDVPCNVPAPITGCCWLHEGPSCKCHTGNHLFCTGCGHEAECHDSGEV